MRIDESKIEFEVFTNRFGVTTISAIAHHEPVRGFTADSLPIAMNASVEEILWRADQAKSRLLLSIKAEHRSCQDAVSIAIGKLATFEREVLV